MFDQYAYLYVDDDRMSREIMRVIMEHLLNVTQLFIFEDSERFMERLRALPLRPQLIMLDIHMRPIDGFAMIAAVRADPQYQNTCVIAITASLAGSEIYQLRQHGFNGAIAKPLDVQTFPGLLQKVLAGEAVWHINE